MRPRFPPPHVGGYGPSWPQTYGMNWRLLDAEKFHLEDEGAVGRDTWARAGLAVSQVGRNLELEFVAHLHELDALGPAANDTVQWETDRLSALHRTVEHGAIEQSAVVMNVHRVRGFWRNRAGSSFHDLVFQTAGSGRHFLCGSGGGAGGWARRIGSSRFHIAGLCSFITTHEEEGGGKWCRESCCHSSIIRLPSMAARNGVSAIAVQGQAASDVGQN